MREYFWFDIELLGKYYLGEEEGYFPLNLMVRIYFDLINKGASYIWD